MGGKYALLTGMDSGYRHNTQLYLSNLEKLGEITGKIPLTPIWIGSENSFTVTLKICFIENLHILSNK